jgi:[acyl-carrier-protein] S-malonyltransferase
VTRIALLFPGQGAQKPGMGEDIARSFEEAADVFEQANDALGMDLQRVCFEGPQEDLNRTDISQPAILTVSMAVLKVVENQIAPLEKLEVVGAGGLSLGEYSALVAAGSLDFADAVRLVQKRGKYMQEACDAQAGTMYSIIGLDDAEIEQVCEQIRSETRKGVWPANYNSPGQLVISGDETAASRAAELCDEKGARRAIQLRVAGAFHTEMMASAARKLSEELEQVDFAEQDFPVVANAAARPAENSNEVRSLLTQQVSNPVRWKQSMRWLIDRGAQNFYELGPGRVLRGLLRRIDRDVDCLSVGSASDIDEMAEELEI